MNRRGFLGSIAAVLAFPKRFFKRNTLITPEWVFQQLRTGPHRTIPVKFDGKYYEMIIADDGKAVSQWKSD